MRVRARVALPSGAEVELSPGDMIGRLAHAALSIADPSVSEAHALVSLRAGRLMLLALRRRFEVDGQSRDEVVLEPGLEIGLAASVRLLVLEVALPESVLGVRLPGLPAIPLPPVISLFAERLPRTKLGYDARADIVLFTDGPRFFASTPGDPAREVSVGAVLEARDTRFELVAVHLDQGHPGYDGAPLAGWLRTHGYGEMQCLHFLAACFIVGGIIISFLRLKPRRLE